MLLTSIYGSFPPNSTKLARFYNNTRWNYFYFLQRTVSPGGTWQSWQGNALLEEEPARREDQTGNIQNVLLQIKKRGGQTEKIQSVLLKRKKLFFKNLSGIEYGGAEEAKKDESWDYSSFDKPLLRPPTNMKTNASVFLTFPHLFCTSLCRQAQMYRNVRGQASLDMNIDSVISSNTWKYGLCYIVELLQYLFHRDVQDVSTRFSLDNCLISFPYKSQSILKVMVAITQLASRKPAARIQHWHKLLLDSQSCSDSAHSFVSLQGSWD